MTNNSEKSCVKMEELLELRRQRKLAEIAKTPHPCDFWCYLLCWFTGIFNLCREHENGD